MLVKKNFKIIICLLTVFTLVISPLGIAYGEENFKVEANSAILIDASTGKVLIEKNAHEKLPPASVTKIMVMLLAMEALENNKMTLEDEVLVSANASGMGGSQVYLEEGEVQKVNTLMTAIALRSANDASVALAEHLAGSEELFIGLMNERAKELGMKNTNFSNTSGLPDENHYTTAYDISLMSRELLKYPKIHDWLTIWMTDIEVGKKKDKVQSLVNTNRLIRFYPGATGLKTGYTSEAKYCLSASATKGNLSLIAVVLGCDTSDIRFREIRKMLDYGFATYDSSPIANKGDSIRRLKVHKGRVDEINIVVEEKLNILVKKGQTGNIEKEIILPDYIDAPLEKNQVVGEIVARIDNKEVGRVNLITSEEVERASLVNTFRKILRNLIIVR